MGMPEQTQNGMNIAPDGTVYEILEDGTIKRIGKVSPDGSFEPFGGVKEGIREQDGIIYRVVNGKEVKIGRILPNGEIETINQRIRNEAEVARNKFKIVTIVSVCCLTAFLSVLYVINSQQQVKIKTAEINAKIRQEELAAQERRAEEERKQKKAEAKKAEEAGKAEQAKAEAEAKKAEEAGKAEQAKAEQAKAEAKKAEEERKKREAEAEAKQVEEARKTEQAKAAANKKSKSGGGTRIGSLYWSKRSSRAMTWNEAKEYCLNLTEGGYSDWRLPTIDELRTTIKNCSKTETGGQCKVSERNGCLAGRCWNPDGSCYCEDRNNNGGYYSKLGDDDNVRLWSSSTYAYSTNLAWRVLFVNGDVYYRNKTNDYYVRCVR